MSILIAPAVLVGIALALGAGLVWARSRLPGNDDVLIDAVEALLPQTQCAQCGYPGCRPYAEAVAKGAALDLCPPGGQETIATLRDLLGENGDAAAEGSLRRQPVDFPGQPATKGLVPSPRDATKHRAGGRVKASAEAFAADADGICELVAKVREPECVGCALCIKSCPVDAIIGAPGFMHSVLEQHCTGCELCLPACPADCIDLMPAPVPEILASPLAATPKNKRQLPSRDGNQPTRRLANSSKSQLGSPQSAMEDAPCIGCNRCEEVCPEGLAPQHLLRLLRAGQSAEAAAADLGKCIECRLCDRACPTDIPLAGIFNGTKSELARQAAKEASAAAAKARFEARTARLAQQAATADTRRAARLERLRGRHRVGAQRTQR